MYRYYDILKNCNMRENNTVYSLLTTHYLAHDHKYKNLIE